MLALYCSSEGFILLSTSAFRASSFLSESAFTKLLKSSERPDWFSGL
jgi:hypothetical protein